MAKGAKERLLKFLKEIDFDRDFVIDAAADRAYSYNEFFTRVFKISESEKIRDGVSIFASMENSCFLCMLYFAALFAEKVIAVADPEKSLGELKRIRDENPGAAVFSDAYGFTLPEGGGRSLESVKNAVIRAFSDIDFDRDFLVTYTSGTSGETKGVLHSFGNLILSAYALGEMNGIKTGGTYLHVMPMTYMAGILNSIFFPFVFG